MARPKQNEMPLKGEGVEVTTDKKLIQLADQFVELRDKKADLATSITATEVKILDRMVELKIASFRFADQLVLLTTGKNHVKIKTVQVESDDAPAD